MTSSMGKLCPYRRPNPHTSKGEPVTKFCNKLVSKLAVQSPASVFFSMLSNLATFSILHSSVISEVYYLLADDCLKSGDNQ